MEVHGFCAPGFEPLYDVFAANFLTRGDTGAAFAVRQHGELIVSLWAGTMDDNHERAFEQATLANVFSASKGVLALLALQLVASGQLQLDKPIARYWPEFGAAGKSTITARQLLCHRAGLIAFRQKVADTLIYDWSKACALVAATAPWWQPGSQQGYAPFLYGWSLGGLIEAVTKRPLTEWYRQSLAQVLTLDGGFGAMGHNSTAIADIRPLKKPLQQLRDNVIGRSIKADRQGPVAAAFTNPISLMVGTNGNNWRSALIPAANGHFSARDLAAIYGDLAQTDPLTLPRTWVRRAAEVQSREHDTILQTEAAFGLGFMLSGTASDLHFGGSQGFGHPGAGGSVGFADPERGLGCGYLSTRMGQSLFMDQRAVSLIECLYGLL